MFALIVEVSQAVRLQSASLQLHAHSAQPLTGFSGHIGVAVYALEYQLAGAKLRRYVAGRPNENHGFQLAATHCAMSAKWGGNSTSSPGSVNGHSKRQPRRSRAAA